MPSTTAMPRLSLPWGTLYSTMRSIQSTAIFTWLSSFSACTSSARSLSKTSRNAFWARARRRGEKGGRGGGSASDRGSARARRGSETSQGRQLDVPRRVAVELSARIGIARDRAAGGRARASDERAPSCRRPSRSSDRMRGSSVAFGGVRAGDVGALTRAMDKSHNLQRFCYSGWEARARSVVAAPRPSSATLTIDLAPAIAHSPRARAMSSDRESFGVRGPRLRGGARPSATTPAALRDAPERATARRRRRARSTPSSSARRSRPQTPLTEEQRQKIATQVEFYFSDANLPTDAFLMRRVRRSRGVGPARGRLRVQPHETAVEEAPRTPSSRTSSRRSPPS